MRGLLAVGTILLASAGVAAQDQPDTGGKERLFISPMGEPFRSAGAEPQDLWFQAADTNHDGALSLAEFTADAMRFFVKLDRQRDGEIDPQDLENYETVIAPEIRVAGGGGDRVQARQSPGEDGQPAPKIDYPTQQGAARYSYFPYPEPVIVADTNFNRGVDPREFQKAATDRFDVLDTNHDGKIAQGELPKLNAPRADSRPQRGDRKREKGFHGSRQPVLGGGGF